MLKTFEIASRLTMHSNVGTVLARVNADLLKTHSLLEQVGDRVDRVERAFSKLRGVSRTVGSITRALERMDRAHTGGAQQVGAMQGALERVLRTQREIVSQANAMANAWRAGAQAMNGAQNRLAVGQGPGGRTRAGYSASDAATDAGTLGAAGRAGQGLLAKTAQATFAPQYYKNLLAQDKRVTPEQVAQAEAAVLAATRSAPGFSLGKGWEAVVDLKTVTGDMQQTLAVLPQFALLSTVISAADKRRGGEGDLAFAAAKSLELLGRLTTEQVGSDGRKHHVVDTNQLTKYTSAMASVSLATGGKVGPDEYLNYAKQGRVGALRQNDEFTFKVLPSLLGTIGGQRTGTAINSMNQVFEGNRLQAKTALALEEAGLTEGKAVSRVKDKKTGKWKTVVNEKAIVGHELMQTNLFEWVKLVSKRLEDKGHNRQQILAIMQRISQRSTIGGMMADLYANIDAVEKDMKNVGAMPSNPEEFARFTSSNPLARLETFKAAFEGLLNAFGGPAFDPAMALLDRLTQAMNRLADWARADPDTAGKITMVVAGLSGLGVAIAGVATALTVAGAALRVSGWALGMGGAAGGVAAAASAAAGGSAATAGRLGLRLAARAAGGVGLGLFALEAGQALADKAGFKPLSQDQAARLGHPQLAAPNDGYDVMGRRIQTAAPQAAPRPGPVEVKSQAPLKVHVVNQLTPSEISNGVAGNLANRLSRAGTGSAGTNTLVTPPMPGN